MPGLVALCALAAAYGRIVRENLLPHTLLLVVAAMVFSFFAADQQLDTMWIIQFVFNLAFFGAFFATGHFAGRWLDRDKYQDEED